MAIRKNTKRIDPRYFLNETTYRDLEEEEIPPTTSHDEQGNHTGPQLDEKEVLQLVSNFYKAMYSARNNILARSDDGRDKNWAQRDAQNRARRANPEIEWKAYYQDTVGAPMWVAARAMAPVYDAVKKGWRARPGDDSGNPINVITHEAGDMAEKFLQQKDPQDKLAFLQQFQELTADYFTRTERFGKGIIL
jgi:hypothetical protein